MNRGAHIKRFAIILFFAVFAGGVCHAQDDVQFTLFPWASSYFNAGAIGEQSNTLCFTAIYNNKYLGWNDVYMQGDSLMKDKTAPQDFMFSIESYLKKLKGSLGLTITNDIIGYYNNVGIKLGYSYKLRIGAGHLGIGAQVSLYNQKLKSSDSWRPIQPGDPVLDRLGESTMDLDFSFGVQYKSDQWYAGVGVTQIASAFDKNRVLRLAGNQDYISRNPQLYVHGGYDWIVPANPNWEIIPHAMVKTDFKTYQIDIMGLVRYNGVFWGGLGYRLNDNVNLIFGARPFHNSSNVFLKGLEAAVSYGITANNLGYRVNRSFGDVEVMVRYCFDIYKPEVFSGYGSTRNIYKNQY
ncbi:MAG: PorP/SprF family type IX secretion system membrane protein [Bacteroidales bacterium]|nr:PorP/SprF family type IX secretion system membrane protein [Bacteroidales bacterium]